MDGEIAPTKYSRPHFWEEVAKRKVGDPKWEWYRSEVIGEHDFLLEGGEPRLISKGPRKGQRSWKHLSPTQIKKVVVTEAEIKQAEADYERDTGKCHACGGTGQEWWGWDRATGDKVKPCRRCEATGNARRDSSASNERPEGT